MLYYIIISIAIMGLIGAFIAFVNYKSNNVMYLSFLISVLALTSLFILQVNASDKTVATTTQTIQSAKKISTQIKTATYTHYDIKLTNSDNMSVEPTRIVHHATQNKIVTNNIQNVVTLFGHQITISTQSRNETILYLEK